MKNQLQNSWKLCLVCPWYDFEKKNCLMWIHGLTFWEPQPDSSGRDLPSCWPTAHSLFLSPVRSKTKPTSVARPNSLLKPAAAAVSWKFSSCVWGYISDALSGVRSQLALDGRRPTLPSNERGKTGWRASGGPKKIEGGSTRRVASFRRLPTL